MIWPSELKLHGPGGRFRRNRRNHERKNTKTNTNKTLVLGTTSHKPLGSDISNETTHILGNMKCISSAVKYWLQSYQYKIMSLVLEYLCTSFVEINDMVWFASIVRYALSQNICFTDTTYLRAWAGWCLYKAYHKTVKCQTNTMWFVNRNR